MSAHYTVMFETDDDGWWVVHCVCGWGKDGQVFPAADDAADAYGDHRAETG